jgi:uncharacterized protein (TIGR00725 family)
MKIRVGKKKLVIGILGSAVKELNRYTARSAKKIGRLIALSGFDVATGAGIGAPHIAIKEAKKFGSKTIGFSPSPNEKIHKKQGDNANLLDFDCLNFSNGFTNRSIDLISFCDALVVIGGRMGTLSEYAIAFEENKTIGVLENTNGIARYLRNITIKCRKKRSNPVYFCKDVDVLFYKLVKNFSIKQI